MSITVILFGLLGALMNRIRGGFLKERIFKGITIRNKVYNYNKILNDMVFGLSSSTLASLNYQGVINGIPHLEFSPFDWEFALWAAVCMALGRSLGWGVYIGRLGGWNKEQWKEVEFIDEIIEPLKSSPRLWGFAGLSLRGGVFGLPLAILTHSYIPALAGLTMGAVYFTTMEISKLIYKRPEEGWPLGEWAFGFVLWVAFGCTVYSG